MTTTIDYHTTVRTQQRRYQLRASSDVRPDTVRIEVHGCDENGAVRTEGLLTVPTEDLIELTRLFQRTAGGLAALHAPPGSVRMDPVGRQRHKPWTPELDQELVREWTQCATSTRPAAAHREMAEFFGRTPGSIRSRLLKLGVDPDHPGERRTPWQIGDSDPPTDAATAPSEKPESSEASFSAHGP